MVKSNLPALLPLTGALEYPNRRGTYQFPKEALDTLEMTGYRINKLFRGEAEPTLEEVNRLCAYYGWHPSEVLIFNAKAAS